MHLMPTERKIRNTKTNRQKLKQNRNRMMERHITKTKGRDNIDYASPIFLLFKIRKYLAGFIKFCANQR